MKQLYCIKNARIVNEGQIIEGDVTVKNGRFELVGGIHNSAGSQEIDFEGHFLIPGIIDDQVHFREPGLTYKATIASESQAAAAGGVTSFMEMPNTIPPAVTIAELEKKYETAAHTSAVNYSFFLGASNDNIDEIMRADYSSICGIKIFMGSSTGNLLVDSDTALNSIFKNAPSIVATHCEDEETVRLNLAHYQEMYGEDIQPQSHPLIRSAEGCYLSSSKAVELAKIYNTRLHILHISTAIETSLFEALPLAQKRITAEACVHHLFFNDTYYTAMGNKLKVNPAVKTASDQTAIFRALLEGRIDVIATDHAPHTLAEKSGNYLQVPSGMPLVQHSLRMMLTFVQNGKLSLPQLVHFMSHAPAICFKVRERGFIRPGYYADFVQLQTDTSSVIDAENLFYKCGWSPMEGHTLPGNVHRTWVNGSLVFDKGKIIQTNGQRLTFDSHL